MKKIAVLIILLLISFLYLNYLLSSTGKVDQVVNFTVESGQSLNSVSTDLRDNQLIRSELVFKLYAKLIGKQSKVLAGSYEFNREMDASEILNILTTISSDRELTITIIEGWRAKEIANYLDEKGIVSEVDFLQEIETSKWKNDYDFLTNVSAKTVEGFLFPDTYRIFADATASDIVKKMLDTFDSKLTSQMRGDITSSGKNIFDVVILASIIEREVPNNDDKKIIADIFFKRIQAGIALQSDATVNYVTGQGRAQPTYKDLEVDSPYNTYKYRGLTPGPISNPGISSIEAVIYPTSNPYYYFLTTLDDGTVIYGRTYEEHLNNKARYLD